MTTDIPFCQAEMVSEAGFTRGLFTQASAAAVVAAECKVSPGNVLTVKVSADGRHFKLVATNKAVTSYKVVADTAVGGAVQVTERGA